MVFNHHKPLIIIKVIPKIDTSVLKLVRIFPSTPVFHVAAQRLHTGADCSNDERRFHIWVRVSLQSLHNINDISVPARK